MAPQALRLLMDWEQATRTWVEQGLIEDEQRPALHAWLEEHAAQGRFGEVVLTVLVTGACWLLTGSLALAVDLAGVEGDGPVYACLAAGILQAVLGLGARFSLGRPVAQGLWTATVPVVVLSVMVVLDGPWRGPELVYLVPTLLPALIGTIVASLDRMPGLAAASGLAAAVPMLAELFDLKAPFPEAIAVVCLALTGVYAVGALLASERVASLQAQIPFVTLVGVSGLIAHRSFFSTSSTGSAWESGALIGLYGALVLGAAAVAQSRWTLVSGVGALITAEVVLLSAVGSVPVAITVLGLEGLGLLVGAFAYVAMQAGKRRKAAASVS